MDNEKKKLDPTTFLVLWISIVIVISFVLVYLLPFDYATNSIIGIPIFLILLLWLIIYFWKWIKKKRE
jgi:hypothetical protein